MALPRFARERRLSSCFCALGGKNPPREGVASIMKSSGRTGLHHEALMLEAHSRYVKKKKKMSEKSCSCLPTPGASLETGHRALFFLFFFIFFLTRGWWSVYEWAKRPGRWLVPLCLRVPWALWYPFRSSLDQTALAIITKYNQHVITWHKYMLSAFPQMKYGRHTFLFILSFSSFHWSHNLRVFDPKLRFGWWIANVITDYISSLFTRVFVTAP